MSRTWKQGLLALPGVGASLLPNLACPLCWPAYAGLLSSVGLGFLISAAYLLPLTAVLLILALAAMAFRANSRHGYGPFLLGLLAATAVLLGKFRWESSPTMYGQSLFWLSPRCGMRGRFARYPARRTSAIAANQKELIEVKLRF